MTKVVEKIVVAEPKIQEKCYLPARFVLTSFIFWGICLEFAQKMCLNVTIVVMVNQTALDKPNDPNNSSQDDLSCPNPLTLNETHSQPQGEYTWSPSTQGVILGAYFYGFVCTQMFGGRLAELAGGKWPLGLSILIGSLLTLITPIAADIGVAAIVAVRVTMGLFHGICLPTVFAMFAHWAPVEERSTLLASCMVADKLGTVLSLSLSGYLSENGFAGGWPSVFYIFGILGCIWFMFWACLAYNTPSDHPRISLKELDYLQKGNTNMRDDQKLPVPWKQVLCSMPVWSIAIAKFCVIWGTTTLITKLPTYLENVLHVPIQKNGYLNSLIHVGSCVTLLLSAYLSDYLRSQKGWNPTKIRKGFQMIATFGPAVCIAVIPSIGCQKGISIALFILTMSLKGFVGGGSTPIAADMATHHAATLLGLINGFACTAGIFSPLVAGLILDKAHASITQWSSVFYLCAVLYAFGGIVFLIWASAERQSWAYVPEREKFLVYESKEKESIFSVREDDQEKSSTYGSIIRDL